MDGERLGRLMRMRERLRDVRRGELAVAEAEVETARRAIDAARDASERARRALCESQETGVFELEDRARALEEARRHEDAARADVARRQELREECVRALWSAERDVRSIEVIGKRISRLELKRVGAREQRDLDDRARRARGPR